MPKELLELERLLPKVLLELERLLEPKPVLLREVPNVLLDDVERLLLLLREAPKPPLLLPPLARPKPLPKDDEPLTLRLAWKRS